MILNISKSFEIFRSYGSSVAFCVRSTNTFDCYHYRGRLSETLAVIMTLVLIHKEHQSKTSKEEREIFFHVS